MDCADSDTVQEVQEIHSAEWVMSAREYSERSRGRDCESDESGESGESSQRIKQNRQANSLSSSTLPLIQ